jgi:translation initiation factor IF-3
LAGALHSVIFPCLRNLGSPVSFPAGVTGRCCLSEQKVRINEQIRLSPVRLIGAGGEQVGIVPIEEARKVASEAGLDLVEVAPDARPIVVRVMDWGKHRFEANKKAREARKKESRISIKQVKLRPNISTHDLETKLNHARRFLADGDKVKVTIMFRGRDLRRPENGRKLLQKVIEIMDEVAIVESAPGGIVNRDMSMVLGPKKS